ncbi:SRPBCC family protein [Gordonia sp. SL306]|uniref:SRPBCC family protein n=1 Tax=Gordonia sp. SL306 TaxID=2995145 RepID=UPI002271C637|nr:SRPBCC family protein [Gordonia sp. SL306]WAC53915.1 SRPBCC family protein [Gordonia sp. SL306]
MEWTGARYADGPTAQVRIRVAAPPVAVWQVVSDVESMAEMSSELQSVRWTDPTAEPGVGATFIGSSRHPAMGEWSTTSHVVEWTPLKSFAWAVEDVDSPSATWRFTLHDDGDETLLTQWVRMGPGRSGLSAAIDAMPDKEQKIVFVRMREFEANMTATLDQIKDRAELLARGADRHAPGATTTPEARS